MAEYDMAIHSNPDAKAWAKSFIDTQKRTDFVVDEDLMTAWFANAMMAMHDHIQSVRVINGDHAEYLLEQAQAPQPAELTDAEIRDVLEAAFIGANKKRDLQDDMTIARAVLAAHGAKK